MGGGARRGRDAGLKRRGQGRPGGWRGERDVTFGLQWRVLSAVVSPDFLLDLGGRLAVSALNGALLHGHGAVDLKREAF